MALKEAFLGDDDTLMGSFLSFLLEEGIHTGRSGVCRLDISAQSAGSLFNGVTPARFDASENVFVLLIVVSLPLNDLKGFWSFDGSYDSRTTKVFFAYGKKSHRISELGRCVRFNCFRIQPGKSGASS